VPVAAGNIWQAAAVLLGFQLAAFTWRLQRELTMESEGETVWVPLADWLNLVAFVVVAGGVFLLPVLGDSNRTLPRNAFGLGVVILAFYPFALLGHYKLFRPREPFVKRPVCPWEEGIVLIGAALAVIGYIVAALT
jgi:hypothetical protein